MKMSEKKTIENGTQNADLSRLRQIPAPGPNKVKCKRKFAFLRGADGNLRVLCEIEGKNMVLEQN
jgi:hypothetical protein